MMSRKPSRSPSWKSSPTEMKTVGTPVAMPMAYWTSRFYVKQSAPGLHITASPATYSLNTSLAAGLAVGSAVEGLEGESRGRRDVGAELAEEGLEDP